MCENVARRRRAFLSLARRSPVPIILDNAADDITASRRAAVMRFAAVALRRRACVTEKIISTTYRASNRYEIAGKRSRVSVPMENAARLISTGLINLNNRGSLIASTKFRRQTADVSILTNLNLRRGEVVASREIDAR